MRLFRSLIQGIGKVDVNNILEETGCPLSANTIKVLSEVGFEPTPPERMRPERQLPTARPAKCFSFSQSRPQILKQLEPITFAQSKTFHQSRQKSWRATSGTRQKFWRATSGDV